jgi:hypothetical protein
MCRRTVGLILALGLLVAPLAAAPAAGKVARIGMLTPASEPSIPALR